MPAIHDLRGPAGRLEATDRRAHDRSKGGGRLCASASHARRHNAHQGGVPGHEGSRRALDAPCCASIFVVSDGARARSIRETARRRTFAPRSATWRLATRASHCGRPASRSARGSRSRPSAADPRVSVLIGIAPPVSKAGYDFSLTRESTKPKFFVQGEADDICPIQDMWKFYGELQEPKELVVIDAADHLFDGHTAESRRSTRRPAVGFHRRRRYDVSRGRRTP